MLFSFFDAPGAPAQTQKDREQRERPAGQISLDWKQAGRVSVGVYDLATGRLVRTLLRGEQQGVGHHQLTWDGLDDRGRPVAAGKYEWRAVNSQGFKARYVTSIGINPPGGEQEIPQRSWVGDHAGAGIVAVDESGCYVGSPFTENLMTLVKIDSKMKRVEWSRPQFYDGGALRQVAVVADAVCLLQPDGKLRRLRKTNGEVLSEWQVADKKQLPTDLAGRGRNLILLTRNPDLVRWLSTENGKELAVVPMPGANCVTAESGNEKGTAVVAIGNDIYRIEPGRAAKKLLSLKGIIGSLDYDPGRRELWAVIDKHRAVRIDEKFQVVQEYGGQQRPEGPFDPTLFAGVEDIAADGAGGAFLCEPTHAPRRMVHVGRDGKILGQWFGGMAFYVNGTFDPEDPTAMYGISPEGWMNQYRIDFETGSWKIEACYKTGLLGDGLFPGAGLWRAVRRGGQLYFYHRVIPAVIRLDATKRRAVPIAIAARVLNSGRTFFQFAGSGRQGYPKPWVAACEHHKFKDLEKAPKLFSWTDSNGNGEFDAEEFTFSNSSASLSFHFPGDFTAVGDYLGAAGTNDRHAILRLPVSRWEGLEKSAPRWDWDKAELVGEISVDPLGYGVSRNVSVAPDGMTYVVFHAGLLIREHGQYEGGRWPEQSIRANRILAYDSRLRPLFAVGLQSKEPKQANTGVHFFPAQTSSGPNRTLVVNDQTIQSPQVWTHDGLYLGSFFDQRTDDGRGAGFYSIHGDDNQGGELVVTKNGKCYWLAPTIGFNRLYEITGWDAPPRQKGTIDRPKKVSSASGKGTGLKARYLRGDKVLHETTEAPTYFDPFGADPHSTKVQAPFRVEWTGSVEAPLTDRFRFSAFLGADEKLRVWVDDVLIYSQHHGAAVDLPVNLIAGKKHSIKIEYINPANRAELKLLWSSRVLDSTPISPNSLFP
jgi:hypothetical protein